MVTSHALAGISRARPRRDASITRSAHTCRTVLLACTTLRSNVATSGGKIAIANVCQECSPEHGNGAAVVLPEISTVPFQHSWLSGQRAWPPGTLAAGQRAAVVGTPYTPGTIAAAPLPDVVGWVPAAPWVLAAGLSASETASAAIKAKQAVTAIISLVRRLFPDLGAAACPCDSVHAAGPFHPPGAVVPDVSGRSEGASEAAGMTTGGAAAGVRGSTGTPSSASRKAAALGSRAPGSAAMHCRSTSINPAGTPRMSGGGISRSPYSTTGLSTEPDGICGG